MQPDCPQTFFHAFAKLPTLLETLICDSKVATGRTAVFIYPLSSNISTASFKPICITEEDFPDPAIPVTNG
jgi:hypothetical protein